jgi:heat shock protein HtpX
MQAFGLYTHIKANERKSKLLIFGLFLLVYLLGFGVMLMISGDINALLVVPVVTILTTLWVIIGMKYNASMIASVTGATPVNSPKLYNLLENLCISRGMTTPQLHIIETDALNAFASGMNEKQYTVTVTRGLIDALNEEEIEAVLAHELTHIRNGDVKLMITAVLIAGVISFFGEMLFRVRMSGESKKGMAIGAVMVMIAWFFAVIIRFALSRSREYLADAGAVELTKNPDAMISALLKISGRSDMDVPSGIMDMCIENDANEGWDIFSTHPSTAKRVQALQVMAGGRVPLASRQALPNIVNQHPKSLEQGGQVAVFGGKVPFGNKNNA